MPLHVADVQRLDSWGDHSVIAALQSVGKPPRNRALIRSAGVAQG
jgi:hypothetical protein